MQKSRVAAALAIGAVAVLTGASPAWAGTLGKAGGDLRFDGAGAERNAVTVRFVENTFEFHDAASPLTVDPAVCTQVDANTGRCPSAGVDRLVLALGAGDDAATNATATPSAQSGGDGRDVLAGGPGPDVLDGEAGDDRITGSGGDDVLNGGPGADVLDGQTGVDLIDAGDGDDRMIDRINAGGADSPDRYTCGAGTDRVDADIADIVDADCEQVTRPVAGPGGGLVVGPVAPDRGPQPGPCGPDVLGTAAADRLAGDGGRNRIFGLVGDDDLRGGGGADCLYGGQGKDRVAGQAGADVVAGGAGDDRLAGHGGRDRLSGGAGDDVLRVGGGRNVAEGGGGDDVVVSANGRRDVIRCGPGADRVRADRVDRLRGCEKVRRGG